jgi:serine/threonine protein kinase
MSSSADGHPTTAEEMETMRVAQAQPGDVIGSYRVLRLIGEGAVGRVFEVEHVKIGRRAAMKVLSPEHALRPMAVRRLFSEAQAVNRIDHPHIVEITDVVDAERPGGASGVVMELLEGQSLAQLLIKEGPIPPERFIPILTQVADALSAAHAVGFVHRDLKPENIFLTERHGQADYVKLLDFGLAKSLAPDLATTSVNGGQGGAVVRQHQTVEGTFLGTPAYASPEQASGKPVDRRSDLYSLGVILYELLCGRLPFEGANLGEYLVQHITAEVPGPPREVSDSDAGRALFRLARRCLEKDPALRIASAGELKDTLERILAGEYGEPRRLTLRSPLVLGGGAALLLLVGLTVALVGRKPPAPPPKSALAASAAGPRIEALERPATRTVIRFQSIPPGAEVRRLGEGELLGITPFQQSFERPPVQTDRSQMAHFEMRLPGHESERFSVDLAQDAVIERALRRVLVPPPPARRPGRSRADREGTMDPFSR